MIAMTPDEPSSIQTRPGLLNRLRRGDDTQSWEEFYRVYGKLVRDFSLQAGLTDTEADEVVQETTIAMARHLPEYRYNPKVCRFKTWLLNQASWRIKDQLKRRKKDPNWQRNMTERSFPSLEDTARTSTIQRMPDSAAPDLDALFDSQWRKNLLDLAVERVKEKFSLKQMQVFDLVVLKEWPGNEVARLLGITLANVYVTRHRISAAVTKEVKRLDLQLK